MSVYSINSVCVLLWGSDKAAGPRKCSYVSIHLFICAFWDIALKNTRRKRQDVYKCA